MLGFIIKHYICDFPLQKWPYMYMNKGKLGHPGGILHAFVHGVGTAIMLTAYCLVKTLPMTICMLISLIDVVTHYLIDWWKMDMNNRKGWGPLTHSEYWVLLGADQMFHYITYIGIAWMLI